MVTKIFESQLGKNVEVYIDDMVMKSKVVTEHLMDLGSMFEILSKHKLHLNASKCSFGVSSGKFLWYMITHRGIEVNPDQTKAISDLQVTTSLESQESTKVDWNDCYSKQVYLLVGR